MEQGPHLRSHSGVVGPNGNECGADGGALGCHVQASGSNADALGGNVDPLHMDTASSLVNIPYPEAGMLLRCVRCAACAALHHKGSGFRSKVEGTAQCACKSTMVS